MGNAHITLIAVGISRVHSCGNGEDAEVTLNEGEHKETYYCNWELCNGATGNAINASIVFVTFIVSIANVRMNFMNV